MEDRERWKQKQLHDLSCAIRGGDVESVRQLLLNNPALAQEWYLGRTWLHFAASSGDVNVLSLLLGSGLDVNAEDDTGTTPLDRAVLHGQEGVIRLLLQAGARIRQTSEGHSGTIILAVNVGLLAIVELLLAYGADPQATYGSPPQNALSHALLRGHTEIANILRGRGCTLPPTNTSDLPTTSQEEIVRHFTKHTGPVNPLSLQEIVPGGMVSVAIHLIPPQAPPEDYGVLFTTGMSDQPLAVPPNHRGDRYAELMMRLPASWPMTRESFHDPVNSWPLDWLRRTAHYFHNERTRIGSNYGIVVNGEPPEPLGPGVPFDSLLLWTYPAEHTRIHLADGREIAVYFVIPLYPAEREFGMAQGLDTLTNRIVQYLIDPGIIDLHRPAVV